MTNTIQQLKEEIMSEYKKELKCIQSGCDGKGNIPHQVGFDEWEAEQCQFCFEVRFPTFKSLSTALDKVIKATADAMVGEEIGETERSASYVFGYNTRILEEKALRDEIVQ